MGWGGKGGDWTEGGFRDRCLLGCVTIHSGISVRPAVCIFRSERSLPFCHAETRPQCRQYQTARCHIPELQYRPKNENEVFGIRGLKKESAGSEWETSLERNMGCTAAPGRDKSRVIQTCTRGEQRKGLRRTTELMSQNVFAHVRKLQNRPLYTSVRTLPRLIHGWRSSGDLLTSAYNSVSVCPSIDDALYLKN